MRKGDLVRFSQKSGNQPSCHVIGGSEWHQGLKFYRLEGITGLFLETSLTKGW